MPKIWFALNFKNNDIFLQIFFYNICLALSRSMSLFDMYVQFVFQDTYDTLSLGILFHSDLKLALISFQNVFLILSRRYTFNIY